MRNKQEFIDKFELKIKLQKAIDEKEITKSEFEYVLKHILKYNMFLKKHFPLFKDFINEMLDECNELLRLNFFVNDRILIIWIARRFNKCVYDNSEIELTLKNYLKEKIESLINGKKREYEKQLYNRTLIYSNDDCYRRYLPIKKSEDYYWYSDEKDVLYPQFDEEFERDCYKGEYNTFFEYRKFNDDELRNIKEFNFNDISEDDLIKEINKYVEEFKRGEREYCTYNVESKVFKWIKEFDNINIYVNSESNFTHDSVITKSEIYELMKKGDFNFNIDDNYFIVEREVFSKDYRKEYGNIVNMESCNHFKSLIDFPKWIKYMRSHNINNLKDMYKDEMYDEFRNIESFGQSDKLKNYLDYNYSDRQIGINKIIWRIKSHMENITKLYEKWHSSDEVEKGYLAYDLRRNHIWLCDGDYYGEYNILLGDGEIKLDMYENEEYLQKKIIERMNEN